MFFFFSTLPLKCYGYFLPLLPPLSAEVIFYLPESYYLASPSLLSSSLQLSWLSAILFCHSNLFLWRYYFVLTSSLHVCVCLCESAHMFGLWILLTWSSVKGIGIFPFIAVPLPYYYKGCGVTSLNTRLSSAEATRNQIINRWNTI